MERIKTKITSKGFTPGNCGTHLVLGELQTDVMEMLWKSTKKMSVLDVENSLLKKREIAHTTVATTLDRMFVKGFLEREKQGKAYIYSPKFSKEEFERGVAQEVLGSLLSQFTEPAISAFVELVGEDSEKLDQLEELIRQKREEIER